MTKYLSFLTGGDLNNDALADAYTIHGDGVARMIPAKLVKRKKFKENLAKIEAVNLETAASWAKKKSDR